MNKKRIIIIRNAKSYDFGGGERFPVFIADILLKNNYIPLIISRSQKLRAFASNYNIPTIKGWWWSHQNWSGAYIILFPIYLLWQLVLTCWYIKVFLEFRPDIIHIQSKDDFIAATIAGKIFRKRIIWTDHADLKHVWKNLIVWYKNPVGKLIYLCSHLVYAISVVSRSEYTLVHANLPKSSKIRRKIAVIYNGVLDTADQFIYSKSDNVFTFCVASRLVSDKGIKEVIDAYKNILPGLPNSQLLLLGDGPEMSSFKRRAKGVANIKFLGHQNNPLEIMSQADAFIHPTYHEGFSVALVEAGMLGLPIIATSVGGNVEIITDRQNGLLVPIQNITSLTEAMRRISTDKDLRQKLGKAARQQYLDRFQFDHIVSESFIPLYEGKSL